jgi:hypothetical protein
MKMKNILGLKLSATTENVGASSPSKPTSERQVLFTLGQTSEHQSNLS